MSRRRRTRRDKRAPQPREHEDEHQALPAEYHKRLFEAAIRDLAAISENLGLDPDEGGAAPIIEAINELRRERDDWVDAQYAAQAQPTSTTSPREEFPLLYDSLDELTSRLDSHQSRDYVFSLRDSIQAVVQKLSLARARVADLEAAAKAQPNGAEIEQLRSENMEMRSTLNVLAPGDKPTHSVNEVLHDLSEAVARLLGWNYWDIPGQPSKDAEFARAALRKAWGDE